MQEQTVYVIGIGDSADWEAGRGSLYYIEDKNGLRAIPVFTSSDQVNTYIEANLDEPTPEAHMDMMESLPEEQVEGLTAGRFAVMPVSWPYGLAEVAAEVDADYLVRDLRAGAQQETMLLSDRAKHLLG